MKRQHATPTRDNRLVTLFCAAMLTLAGGQAGAVSIPDLPLETGGNFPAPNVMFILDNSRSMQYDTIPGDNSNTPEVCYNDGNLGRCTYAINLLHYNPRKTYYPWMQANGTRMTVGTSLNAIYTDNYRVTGTSTTDLRNGWSSGTRPITFYVPKATWTSGTNKAHFYRYQIFPENWSTTAHRGRIVRSEYGARTGSSPNYNRGLDGANCSTSTGDQWRNCTYATPTGRSEADEKRNYATWYSYHRTRMKAAKAGAAEAFSMIGDFVRVGYDSINSESIISGIPTDNDDGRFRGSNKTNWYQLLFSQVETNSTRIYTPLRSALYRTGQYFKTDAPWRGEGGTMLTCRQNFAILTTDGYWNQDSSFNLVGDADSATGTQPQHLRPGETTPSWVYDPTRSPYRDNMCTASGTSTTSCASGSTSQANTLADVAMYFWKNDLRPDMQNDVPDSAADPAYWQHMVTFGVSLGAPGVLPTTALPNITNGSLRWPKVNLDAGSSSIASHVDDLWHATVNSRGNFVLANDTDEFSQGLLDAFATIASRTGSASNVAANSTSLTTDTLVFQAKYISGRWTGELLAYEATSAGLASEPEWSASANIPAWNSRRIITWNGDAGAYFPTADQTAMLDVSDRGESAATGVQNANYIKGDRSREGNSGGGLRQRDHLLGDIVNSSPVYSLDTDTLYFGANDGMLHAVNASTGVERFAYIPGSIDFNALKTLSDPDYGNSADTLHKYFVDGPLSVSQRVRSSGRNILVGALGRGGKGLFALDVTNPGDFRPENVLWERTGATDNDLGHVLGEPLIAKLQDGTDVAIVANGINSTNGRAVLLVINLTSGAVMHRLNTGIGGDNGLFAPRATDLNGDGKIDAVYAGDLKGNLWKFDFSTSTPTIALGGSPLAVATDASGNRQPITGGVAVGRGPSTVPVAQRKVWVFFGTGKFIETSDVTDTSVQSVYGIIEQGATATITRSDLQFRDIHVTTTVGGSQVRGFEPTGPLPENKKGWVLDLDAPQPGERVITRPQLVGNALVFSSRIPPVDDDADPCAAGGSGYINAIDAFSGTSTDQPFFEEDLNGDGVVDENDQIIGNNGGGGGGGDDDDGGGDDDDGNQSPGGPGGGNGVPIGSIDVGIGMPTQSVILDDLLIVCGSDGMCEEVNIDTGAQQEGRAGWTEIILN